MLCQKCGNKTAVVHYTNIVNEQKTEVHLCQSCAKERESNILVGINDLMSDFFGMKAKNNKQIIKCDFCGSTQNDISKKGKAGCENCYNVFSEYLVPIIKRVHGTDVHTGKKPENRAGNKTENSSGNKAEISLKNKKEDDLKNPVKILESQMKQAIADEDYEQAAHLRDEIKKLHQQDQS